MKLAIVTMSLALAASAFAHAQMPGLGSMGAKGVPGVSRLSGGAGLMNGLAPNVSSVGAGNAAGILSYCIKNKYLGAGGAASVMSSLQGKRGVTSSSGYAAGESGRLQMGSGSTLSMDSLKGQMKTKVCDMVLSHSKSLI